MPFGIWYSREPLDHSLDHSREPLTIHEFHQSPLTIHLTIHKSGALDHSRVSPEPLDHSLDHSPEPFEAFTSFTRAPWPFTWPFTRALDHSLDHSPEPLTIHEFYQSPLTIHLTIHEFHESLLTIHLTIHQSPWPFTSFTRGPWPFTWPFTSFTRAPWPFTWPFTRALDHSRVSRELSRPLR
jgi:hypothetical protein